jgi:hypothetical protein
VNKMARYKLLQKFEGNPKGTIVWEYSGCTYGVISNEGIAVTLLAGQTPFFEIPKRLLKEID